jgi:hypothetical protein
MAIVVDTPDPEALIEAINEAIADGNIDTWAVDDEGDYTHTPPQWRQKAWFEPSVEEGVLYFGLLGTEDETMSAETYAVYHGRFIEMLLAHFDQAFTEATATATAASMDSFNMGD